MPPPLSAYQNQLDKMNTINMLAREARPVPTIMPCFTIFRRPCRFGYKFLAVAYPTAQYIFVGFFDSMDDLLNCLALDDKWPGVLCEIRKISPSGVHEANRRLLTDIITSFHIPNFKSLEGRKRAGTTLPYVW